MTTKIELDHDALLTLLKLASSNASEDFLKGVAATALALKGEVYRLRRKAPDFRPGI